MSYMRTLTGAKVGRCRMGAATCQSGALCMHLGQYLLLLAVSADLTSGTETGGSSWPGCPTQLDAFLGDINVACCPSASQCTGTIPDACSQSCSQLWIPFAERCGRFIADNFGDTLGDLTLFTTQCREVAGTIDGGPFQCTGAGCQAAQVSCAYFTPFCGSKLSELSLQLSDLNSGVPVPAHAAILEICPATCATTIADGTSPCVDDPVYMDEQGYHCLQWRDADCTDAVTEWGYSPQGQAHLIAACPLSCGHERCQLVTFGSAAVETITTCGTQGCNVCPTAVAAGLCGPAYDADVFDQSQCEALVSALCGALSNAGALSSCVRAPTCAEVRVTEPQVVGAGCFGNGELGDTCILTCASGYTPSDVVVGVCTVSEDELSASYVGQHVECRPEVGSEAYCQGTAPEIIIEHCCMGSTGDQPHSYAECNGVSHFPHECSVDCADRWLPLWDECAAHLGGVQSLTTLCESTAQDFLSLAPTSISITGLCLAHDYANGVYVLDNRTIASKRAWRKLDSSLGVVHLFFADDEAQDSNRWCMADSLTEGQCFATFRGSYDVPPWHANEWLARCDSTGEMWPLFLDLDPGFTTSDCQHAQALVLEEVSQFCCSEMDECGQGAAPLQCGFDCSRIWSPFANDCGLYISSQFGLLYDDFTAQCEQTQAEMIVISPSGDGQGSVTEDGPPWVAGFSTVQDLLYTISVRPTSPLLSMLSVQVISGTTQQDSSTHSTGAITLQWPAIIDDNVEIRVASMGGDGTFELAVTVVGTLDNLAPEVITSSAVSTDPSVESLCDHTDCTYRYDGQNVHGDGAAFPTRLHGEAGLTYTFKVDLHGIGSERPVGTHISAKIFHADSVGGAKSSEPINVDFALGNWTARGVETYASSHSCSPQHATHVPCGENGFVGEFRTHASNIVGQTSNFGAHREFEWPCPAHGIYFIEWTVNCDVGIFADTSLIDRTSCQSAFSLRTEVADKSTTISTQQIIPVEDGNSGWLTPGSELQAQFASMFTVSQHPSIAYVTEIIPLVRGNCSTNPCQNGGDCNDDHGPVQIGEESTVYTYRCTCPPSWGGLSCDTPASEIAQTAQQGSTTGGGGGHRRTEEYSAPNTFAMFTVNARGQNRELAQDHLDRVLLSSDVTQWGRRLLQHDYDAPKVSNGGEMDTLLRHNAAMLEELREWRTGQRLSYLRRQMSTERSTAVRRVQENSCDGYTCVYHRSGDNVAMLCPVDQCSPVNPCLHGGTCSTVNMNQELSGGLPTAFTCTCLPGWVGPTCASCETGVDDACGSHGSCSQDTGACDCTDNWSGDRCEKSPCFNVDCNEPNGQCFETGAHAGECSCFSGFAPPHCSTSLCEGVNCGDNGECKDGLCDCDSGYISPGPGVACEAAMPTPAPEPTFGCALAGGTESDELTPAPLRSLSPDGGLLESTLQAGVSDVYRFVATAGTTYTITIRLGTLSDSILDLWATPRPCESDWAHTAMCQCLLVENDDINDNDYASRITGWEAPTSDTYYIEVKSYYDDEGGSYSVEIMQTSGSHTAATVVSGNPCHGGQSIQAADPGVILLPPYPNNAHCDWNIVCGDGETVAVTFTSINVEAGWDFINVGDQAADMCEVSEQYLDRTFEAPSGSMTIHFTSDESVTGFGFEGWYMCLIQQQVFGVPVDSACSSGGTLAPPPQITIGSGSQAGDLQCCSTVCTFSLVTVASSCDACLLDSRDCSEVQCCEAELQTAQSVWQGNNGGRRRQLDEGTYGYYYPCNPNC